MTVTATDAVPDPATTVSTLPVSIATATAITTVTTTATVTLGTLIATLTSTVALSQTAPPPTAAPATAMVGTGIATATVTATLTTSYAATSTLLVTVSTSSWVLRTVSGKLAESPPSSLCFPLCFLAFPAWATTETDFATCSVEQQQPADADHGGDLLRTLLHAARACGGNQPG